MITLIEKKGKDKRYLKSWRPISLINVDAKIASKAIAMRINKVIAKLVHCDQTAYVNNRYIGESNRLISDILEYTNENDIEAVLFSADFEKAFDSIEHPFLFAVLKSFGFGADFIQWIRTFFNNAESCAMNNGNSTGYFPLERGTRQGDPLSAYLFILVLEILLIQIRNNKDINGVVIYNREIKLSAYADDSSFFVVNTKSLRLIFNICESFEEFSSLKLNLEKSEACWIGSAKGRPDKPANCNWIDLVCDKIRILGVYNSYDTDLANRHNFFDIIGNMKSCLNCWRYRGLAGRIQIFKTLAISKVVYISTMKNPPRQFIEALNEVQQDFVWNKPRSKIKHASLIGNYEEGGYKDVDISTKRTALKITWIRRLLDGNYHPWKIIPEKLFASVGGYSFFHFNLKLSESCLCITEKTFPNFYKQLVDLWIRVSYQEPSGITEICNQALWNNLFIAPQGKPLFNSFFIARNKLKVIDLLSDSGSFLPWHMVKVKYQLNDTHILSWLGLINSIPLSYGRQKSSAIFFDSQHIGTDSMRRNTVWPNLSVKQVYRALVKPLINPPTAQKSPEQYSGKSELYWEEVYLTPLKLQSNHSCGFFNTKS